MMNKRSNKKIVLGMMIFAVGIISIALSHAFLDDLLDFVLSEPENVKVSTANDLKLVYTDCASNNSNDCSNISKNLSAGESLIKTFQIKNETGADASYNLYFKELMNSFINDELVYKIENLDTGEVLIDTTPVPYSKFLVSDITIKENIKIEKNTTHNYKMTITFINTDYIQNSNINAEFSMKISILKKGDPDFSKVATTDETADGLFSMEDDYGTSYYYRGAVTNNYVKFGKNKAGQDMWWRIIRINGDGSLRIQYDGTQGWANGTLNDDRVAITNQPWNVQYNDAKYVGWMFGGAQGQASTSYEEAVKNETNSDMKTAVDNWYVENIKNTGYEKYLSDEIFCNDRTAYTDEAGTTLGNGYGTLQTYYGGHARLIANKTPSFKCPQKNDMFTLKDGVSSEVRRGSIEGNKALDYPVGLVTGDEISAAGGVYEVYNESYYLYKANNSMSISPASKYKDYAQVFYVRAGGRLHGSYVYFTYVAAPVINISSDYIINLQGTGTIDNPYILNL